MLTSFVSAPAGPATGRVARTAPSVPSSLMRPPTVEPVAPVGGMRFGLLETGQTSMASFIEEDLRDQRNSEWEGTGRRMSVQMQPPVNVGTMGTR
jgi:hypothetical protein